MTASQDKNIDNQQPENRHYSLEEYFDFQKTAERRFEYHDGKIVPITSATENHGRIVTNLVRFLGNCLDGTDCEVFAADRDVYVEACNRVFFPDVLIVCGEREYHKRSKNVDATTNPTVVIEVLSNSTKNTDKGVKLRCYRRLASLKQYLIIEQDFKNIEVYEPNINKNWTSRIYEDEGDVIKVGGCKISIDDIYKRVEFAKAESKSDN